MKSLLLLMLAAAPAAAQQVTTLPAQDKVLSGKPVTQFSIGAEDGEDWELLSRVSQVAFDREENLYVLDGGNHRVLIFNPQGKFVRKFGKKGGGPGELLSPVGLALTTDGYIAVTDLGRPAISLFKKDGSFVKNITLGEDYGFPVAVNGTQSHPNGGVAVRTMPRRMMRGNTNDIAASYQGPRSSPVTWFTAADKNTKLFDIPQPEVTPKVQDNGGPQGARQVFVRIQIPAFSPPTLWSILPNGQMALSYDEQYKLQLVSNGKVQRVIQRPISPRKVTEADKEKEKARRRVQMATGGGGMVVATASRTAGGAANTSRSVGGPMPKEEIERSLSELTFNDMIPVLSGLYVDPLNRVWVQRSPREVGGTGPIDLIGVDGRYIGTLNGERLPAAVSLSGRAAYIERDDMDVEKVVVKRLPGTWK
jgi:hypothetical protein